MLIRRRRLVDGRVEVFTPKRTAEGFYVLADRAVDPQHNKAINQFYVKDVNAVVARLRRGGVSLRMCGDITRQENLIRASEVSIERPAEAVDGAASSGVEEDPFATFSEWSSAADAAAYDRL